MERNINVWLLLMHPLLGTRPTPRIKIKREGETDSEEKRFTKNRVRGNGRGRELDASREHTLTENIAP